jgi:hypothetical protein
MPETPPFTLWRRRPELGLAVLGLASGLLSAAVGLDLELAWLRPLAALFFLDSGPLPVGALFGAAIALGLWLATANPVALPVLPVLVMYAWSAAIHVAIRVQRTTDDDPHLIASGLLAGLAGAGLTQLGCSLFAPELRGRARIGVTCAVGAIAGLLVFLGQRQMLDSRLLFVVWQPAVAFCIGLGLRRAPAAGAGASPAASKSA